MRKRSLTQTLPEYPHCMTISLNRLRRNSVTGKEDKHFSILGHGTVRNERVAIHLHLLFASRKTKGIFER